MELKILAPQATTNYIKNPAATIDTSGWVASGSAISRSMEQARFGIASLQVITNGSSLNEGLYYRVNDLEGLGGPVSVSAYVRGSGVVRIRVIDNPAGGQWASRPVVLNATRWQRIEATGTISGSSDVRLYVETSRAGAQVTTFFVDGAQMERSAHATTYCDGNQPGCRWNIVSDDSVSTRPADTREGGYWIRLAGQERKEENLYVTVAGGLGMPSLSLNTQAYALIPGSFYQNKKVHSRVVTFTFHVRNEDYRLCNVSLMELHRLRQTLLDIVKPDLTPGGQEFWMEYQDGPVAVRFKARYEAGLEGEWDIRNKWVQSFPLRLLAVSPLLVEDDQETDTLGVRDNGPVNYILRRKDGEWSDMNGGFNGQVLDLARGTRGEIIAVGSFTVANNSATAIDPTIPANRIAWWDGEAWNQYGVGANGTIRSVDVAPNGYIYVAGDFTSIGGVAANRVAYWDGSAWAAMGTGLNGIGYAVKVSPDGDVYAGGDFDQAGGVTAHNIAMWNGNWNSMGAQDGLNGIVRTIQVSADGLAVYVGGDFTDENTDPGISDFHYVARYESGFNEFYPLGNGFDARVYRLKLTESNRLYAAGEFTGSNDTTSVYLYTAFWNGAGWFAYGVGGNNFIRDLDVDNFGNIVVGGDFTRIGSVESQYAALWNGSDFASMDVQVDDECYAVLFGDDDDIYIAPNGTIARWARRTTVTNIGSVECSPRIYVKGTGTLRWIENQTTKKRIYAELVIQENEEVFIDFGRGTVRSSIRGNLLSFIGSGSALRGWTLNPGDNVIAAMILDDVEAIMQISYTPTHWSVDATSGA